MLRIVLGFLAAVVANFAAVLIIEAVSVALYPIPDEAMKDPAAMKAAMAAMPVAAKLLVLLAWAAGAAAASAVALVISKRPWMAWVGGAVTLFGVILTVTELPHPLWMVLAGVVIPIAVAAVIHRVIPMVPPAVAAEA